MDFRKILKWRQEMGGFNRLAGIRIVEVSKGSATAELSLVPEMLNPLGMAHGGALFTLCDATAGTAAASRGRIAVTLDSSIQYLRPGKAGQTLRAKAQELKHGKNTAVYTVQVWDEQETLLVNSVFEMFYTDKTVEDLTCDG